MKWTLLKIEATVEVTPEGSESSQTLTVDVTPLATRAHEIPNFIGEELIRMEES